LAGAGIEEWLWVSAGKDFCISCCRYAFARRTGAAAGEEFDGVLSSDDYSAYNGYPVKAQQSVWHICGVTLKSD